MMRPRVLIGYSRCKNTQQAFEAAGCDAWTCDLLAAEGKHLQCDIWLAIEMFGPWHMAVLHPMCTYMNMASAWALKDPDFDRYPGVGYHQRVKPGTLVGAARRAAQVSDIENFKRLLELNMPVALENPAPSFINNALRAPRQVIHPHQFGDDASKGTGLWLTNGVPKLTPTCNVAPRWVRSPRGGGVLPRWSNQTDSGQNRLSPGESRWLERSKTYPGIAVAMGDQWGKWLLTYHK